MEQQATRIDIKAIADRETWSYEDYRELTSLLADMKAPTDKLRAVVAAMEQANPDARGSAALKIGIGRYLLCRYNAALSALSAGTDNKDRHFFQGLCHKQSRDYAKAAEEFERARARGWEGPEVDVALVELRALDGDIDGARKTLNRLEKPLGDTPDFLYLRGLVEELSGNDELAADAYEQAIAIKADHTEATFRLAYLSDLNGDEEGAIELYRRCVSEPPVPTNALLNLAVLYEDAGNYDMAASCLRQILACTPSHPRARLFLKDVEAAKTMYYDEDQAKRVARRNAVLDIPVTDFELSVRARNCLKKMNIRTLGDLVRTTEPELLGYKNFGETSLKEIKDMLAAKGLHLGQALEEGSELAIGFLPTPSADHGVLATPVEHVDFSVRSRRALESLGITTLGELVQRTEAELLACKNFGQTSLNEVRQKLGEHGLTLGG